MPAVASKRIKNANTTQQPQVMLERTVLSAKLNELAVDPKNVRQKGPGNIASLKASIAAYGLLSPLTVRLDGNRVLVSAGQRRLKALQELVKDGVLSADSPICVIKIDECDATAVSLAENIMREDMNPADRFTAYQSLIDEGLSIQDVASKFGVSADAVRRSLKLANVHPKIVQALREEHMSYEAVIAYALSDDHERQYAFYKEQPKAHAGNIKRAMTEGHIPFTDKRMILVADTYLERGGAVLEDLFSHDQAGRFAIDIRLVDTLVAQALEDERKSVEDEGWASVAIAESYNDMHQSFPARAYPQPLELEASQQAELESLDGQLQKLYQQDEDDCEEHQVLIDGLEARYAQFTAKQFDLETMKIAHAVIILDHNGSIRVERGLLRSAKSNRGATGEKPVINESLRADLSAMRSTALASHLGDHETTSLALLANGLIATLIQHRHDGLTHISVQSHSYKEPCDAQRTLLADEIASRLPKDRPALEWLIEQTKETLCTLLADLTRLAFQPDRSSNCGDKKLADAIADHTKFDPMQTIGLTETGTSRRLSHANLEAVAARHLTFDDMTAIRAAKKKADAASAFDTALNGKWLPGPLMAFHGQNEA